MNCFRHCGIQSTVAEPTEDPFLDLDEDEAQLEDLAQQLYPDDRMTATEYADADNEVVTLLPLKFLKTGDRSCGKWWYQTVINQRGLMLKMRTRMLMNKVMKNLLQMQSLYTLK